MRRALIVLLMALTMTATATASLTAAPSDHPSDKSSAKKGGPPADRKLIPAEVAGLIVTTTGSKATDAQIAKVESALPTGVAVKAASSVGANTTVIRTSKGLSVAEATAAVAEVKTGSGVTAVEPDYVLTATAASPVTPDDPLFGEQYHLWDSRARSNDRIESILGVGNKFPAGGYSSKAPSLWRSTRGVASARVAVIDSGVVLNHPDLRQRLIDGYDFVSDPVAGGDGDGRDADPADPGDGCEPLSASSWHGTHVSGIVAATADNDRGVAGVAPKVKVQPVRVLGRCGGEGVQSDIADAIRWSAGLPVDGVPTNATPAKVINLSLGGLVPNGCPGFMSRAIRDARSAGATVVAAAGNDNLNLDTDTMIDGQRYYSVPAQCPGVIAVGSTSEYGDRATYSNFGSPIDISAPGGDTGWEDAGLDGQFRAILSTYNGGEFVPGSHTYEYLEGTSMATPVVAGAAALAQSLGSFTPAGVQRALQRAKTRFSLWPEDYFWRCTVDLCGSGIIDLSRLPGPIDRAAITGTATVGQELTAVPGQWNGLKANDFAYSWSRSGKVISGATAATYTLTSEDAGKRIRVKVGPKSSTFSPISSTSLATDAVGN